MDAKERAAREALKFVRNGQIVGLGTGSTVNFFISLLGEKVMKEKLRIRCVATSNATEAIATKNKLDVVGLNEVERIDLAVDGADQVDKNLNLIKGYGGALLREKVVDYRSGKFIVIVDESKIKPHLSGEVPLEILPFGSNFVKKELRRFGIKSNTRKKNGKIFITDNGNWVLDAKFRLIENPREMEVLLKTVPGVIEVGIFTKNVSKVIVGGKKMVRIFG